MFQWSSMETWVAINFGEVKNLFPLDLGQGGSIHMAFLMCLDTPVYNSVTKQVLREDLMPCLVKHLDAWKKSRTFLRGVNRMPEEDERVLGADSVTVKRRLSLSDSYWFKYKNDRFEGGFYALTPYMNEFTELGAEISEKSSPSLTVTGSVNKIWRRVDGVAVLYKVMPPIWVQQEVAAVGLAKKLQLPVNDVTVVSNTEIHVHNFTKPGTMLMRLQPWDLQVTSYTKVPPSFGFTFSSVDEVYKRLKIEGDFHIVTILFDAVVGNYDREKNLSNWGYFKSGTDGKHMHSPLFDFNLAHLTQKNLYLNIVKKQITEEHKVLLRKWRPIVENHGYPAWLENLDGLLKE